MPLSLATALPSYSIILKKASSACQNELMDTSQLLALRQQARDDKAKADLVLLALHRKAADALAGSRAGVVRQAALAHIAKWELDRLCSPHYVKGWRDILALSVSAAREAMLQEDGEGPALRQNTPFSFLMRR